MVVKGPDRACRTVNKSGHEMDRETKVPCALQELAERYRERAKVLRELMFHDEAARCDLTAEEILDAKAKDERIRLTEPQALEYTRGYTSDHLRRSFPDNRDEVDGQRYFEKGTLPRKARHEKRTIERTRRGTRVRIAD